ncbi:MAG: class I SAM-dependent methyltransferase [Candidatus Zixiibacteriota bacterium]
MKDLSKRHFFDQKAPGWDDRNHPDDRQQIEKLAEEFELRPGDWVLDVGTGNGVLLPHLSARAGDKGKILSLDFSWKMISQAQMSKHRANIRFVNGSADSLPLKDGTIDCITCLAAFAHVCAQTEAMREIGRVLKKGGRVYIAHLLGKKELAEHHQRAGGAVEHDVLPPDSEMTKMMRNSGLQDIKIIDQPDLYLASARK